MEIIGIKWSNNNVDITIIRTLAHREIIGNEKADATTKEATILPLAESTPNPAPRPHKLHKIDRKKSNGTKSGP